MLVYRFHWDTFYAAALVPKNFVMRTTSTSRSITAIKFKLWWLQCSESACDIRSCSCSTDGLVET